MNFSVFKAAMDGRKKFEQEQAKNAELQAESASNIKAITTLPNKTNEIINEIKEVTSDLDVALSREGLGLKKV